MMDCKKALQEANGNMEEAVEILRKKGLSLAQKKAGRSANEGILGHYYEASGKTACLVEVNCETDFVVKTEDFRNFVGLITEKVRKENPQDEATFQSEIKESLTGLIGKIGENIQVKKFVRWEACKNEIIGFYLHAGSKIGVLIRIEDPSGKTTSDHAKEIAMHVAAMQPQYVSPENITKATLEKEKEILRAGVDAKKPSEIREKILQGKIGKFYNEVCLENQVFVKDPEGKATVSKWLKGISPSAKIKEFVRLQVGA